MKMKGVLATILTVVLCISGNLLAYSGDGDGSPEYPFEIANKADLLTLGADTENYDKCFILTADIDLDPTLPEGQIFTTALIAPDTNNTDWNTYQGTPFTGVFDGNGKKISNLTISDPGNDSLGLFGFLGGDGQILNIGIVNANIHGKNEVGVLAGWIEGAITSCYATGTVSGNWHVGGLVGFSGSGTISSCYATSAVSATESSIGGLLGQNISGTITSCYATGTVSAADVIGGLVGYSYSGTITSCYATGAVSGIRNYVGGLVGFNDNFGTITSCYATGSVSGNEHVGGLAGWIDSGTISSCYATGTVSGSWHVGGLAGVNINGTINFSFWDTDTSELSDGVGNVDPDPAGVTGKTTVEMQTLSTFTDAGWDFVGETDNGTEDIWTLPSNSYPALSWQTNIPVEMPVFSPDGGYYLDEQTVTITCATLEATIHYTTNGIDPNESDPDIASGDTVSVSVNPATTLKAIAFVTGKTPSAVKSATYSFLYYSGGDGTAGNPYRIATKADLLELAATTTDYSQCFILTADIDMAGETFTQAVIAPDTDNTEDNYFQGTPFTGIFDGNGKKISNLTIAGTDNDYLGLFGQVGTNGQIKTLGVNITITGRDFVGGLVGSNEGTITSCYATGMVSGTDLSVGGLVGDNEGMITSCYATGAVSGELCWYVGGLVGHNEGTITSCYATGAVSGTAWFVGGLVGQNYPGGNVIRCYSTGKPTGNNYVGGLAGTGPGSGGNFVACFWDKETSEIATSAGGVNVQGKTSTEMKTLLTFTNAEWDFVGETANGTADTWKMRCEGMNYPKLTWQQIQTGDFECPDGVNYIDFAVLAAHWEQTGCPTGCENADIDNSGTVNIDDLILFADNWLEGI